MSELRGEAKCPSCGKARFCLMDWTTYVSVICAWCNDKIGELAPHGQGTKVLEELQ